MAKKEAAKKSGKKRKKSTAGETEKDFYVVINTTNDKKDVEVITRALPIRTIGVQVETIVYHKGIPQSVTTHFIPGVKIKTKKLWKYLIVDKGPKPKKDKKKAKK